jgi:SAM-dependent methyltransferase
MFTAVDAYDRFVGRYSAELARRLIATSGLAAGDRALDVGCGPGGLTTELVALLGPDHVAAVDPSPAFVEACRIRNPGVTVEVATAEALPFDNRAFDASLAQLVVNFMTDARAGIGEMKRVTKSRGAVVAAVWDYGGEMTLLRTFWAAAATVQSTGFKRDERNMRFASPGELRELWTAVGLRDVVVSEAVVAAHYADFNDLWQPLESGVGPAGAYTSALPEDRRMALRAEMQRRLGMGDKPFDLTARAWVVTGRVD